MASGYKPDAGSVLKVRVTFGADPSQGDYKYVLIYSQKEIKAEINYYIFLPGQTAPEFVFPSTGKLYPDIASTSTRDVFINYYYENIFSSWSDYIYLTKKGVTEIQEFSDPGLIDQSLVWFPVTANFDKHLLFDPSRLSEGAYWSFNNISGNYDINFQFDFHLLGNSKPLTDQLFYFKFFSIGANGNIHSSIDGSLKNNKKLGPFTREGSGSSINDILKMEVTVI